MLRINLNSPVPVYKQLINEIKRQIDFNILKTGDSLPTIRSLASQLDVDKNTIARAYKDLETLGIIETRGRKGSFVKKKENLEEDDFRKEFKKLILKLIQKGFSRDEIDRIYEANISLFFD